MKRFLTLNGFLILLNLLWSHSAWASAITVNTTNDEYDSTPNTTCSLREAIQTASQDRDFGGCHRVIDTLRNYTIYFQNSSADHPYTLTRRTVDTADTPETGDLDISVSALTIVGEGRDRTIIQAGTSQENAIDRVFDIFLGVVTIKDLTVRNGFSHIDTDRGGCIVNYAALSLTNVLVENCKTFTSGGGISGGILHLKSVTVRNCQATNGGGIRTATGDTITIFNSTISENVATDKGGGIYHETGDLYMVNSTVSGNHVRKPIPSDQEAGGGIYFKNGRALVIHSTITRNGALRGSGIAIENGSFEIKNTILAGNESSQCIIQAGTLRSSGHNLVSDDSCHLTHSTDLASTEVSLAALEMNGGPTPTHALLTSDTLRNPAIDFVPAENCNVPSGLQGVPPLALDSDERGIHRPYNTQCDAGAVELSRQAALINVEQGIKFDDVNTNQTSKAKGTLYNAAESPINIQRISTEGTEFVLDEDRLSNPNACTATTVLQKGEYCSINLKFTPRSEGVLRSSLNIQAHSQGASDTASLVAESGDFRETVFLKGIGLRETAAPVAPPSPEPHANPITPVPPSDPTQTQSDPPQTPPSADFIGGCSLVQE